MKTKHLFFVGMMFVTNLFNACSYEGEELLAGSERNNQLPAAYSALLVDVKPYVSPGMQKLIDKLDAVTTILPLEELIPGIETLFVEDTLSVNHNAVTRAVTATVANGYNDRAFLFRNRPVSLSTTSSAFKESLNLGDFADYTNIYLSAIAVCQYVYFDTPISTFRASTKEGDFIGVNPDKFDVDEISNNTYFTLGYSTEEVAPGELYYLTTYIFIISGGTDIYQGYLLPFKKSGYSYTMGYDYYCESMQWRYYAIQ